MLNFAAIRRWFKKTQALLLPLACIASASSVAHASVAYGISGCSASGDSLRCQLLAILNFLYVAAGLLGLVLIVVLVLAVKSYRKNKTDRRIDI